MAPQLWVLAHTKVVIAATPCFIDSEHDSSGPPARGRLFQFKNDIYLLFEH